MLKIVLASQSPRRKKLLNQLGLIFEILPSQKEEIITSNDPKKIVEELSLQKAIDASKNIEQALVIGADTIVVFNDKVLGKPKSEAEAMEMLSLLSNQTHSVYTGVSFVITDEQCNPIKTFSFFEETKVKFSTLSLEEITAYVATGSPMDKAGAYGIQDDWGSVFVEHIDGDYYNVVGFPLNRFYREVKRFVPNILDTMIFPQV